MAFLLRLVQRSSGRGEGDAPPDAAAEARSQHPGVGRGGVVVGGGGGGGWRRPGWTWGGGTQTNYHTW
jgi:hypothetical protein